MASAGTLKLLLIREVFCFRHMGSCSRDMVTVKNTASPFVIYVITFSTQCAVVTHCLPMSPAAQCWELKGRIGGTQKHF